MTRTVLITGAATRIGKYISHGLAEDGWIVIIHYNRSKELAQALAQKIYKNGGIAHIIGANLNVPLELNNLIEQAHTQFGAIHALINNASTFDDDRLNSFSRADFDHHINVNLYAPLKLTQDFAHQCPTDIHGSVINIIDQRVLNLAPEYFTYNISKSALYTATKTMAQALAPKIRVNGIGPGPTLQNKTQTDAIFTTEKKSTLLGNGSPPHTIVQAVRYLLDADAVTGQMLAVDGGQHLIPNREA